MAVSVNHYEMTNWPKEGYRLGGGFIAERRLKCAWTDRDTLAREILGETYPYNSIGAMAMEAYPEPIKGEALAVGASADMSSYAEAVVVVKYSTQGASEVVSGNLISEWLETSIDFKTLDHRGLQWGVGGGAEALFPAEAPGRIEPTIDYVLLYHELSAVPSSVVTHTGLVNASAVTAYLMGLTFAPETLLYLGAQVGRSITTAGSTGFSVKHRFRFKGNDGHGWNWFWDQRTHGYSQIRLKTGAVHKPYLTAGFNF